MVVLLLLLLLAGVSECSKFRVLSFNIWHSGEEVNDGMAKIAKHITLLDPDVISLQEVMSLDVVKNLTEMLPGDWNYACDDNEYPDHAILTKYKIIPNTISYFKWATHAVIENEHGLPMHFWAVHVNWRDMGNYVIFNETATEEQKTEAAKDKIREDVLMEIINTKAMSESLATSNTVPVIVAGDFNSPSHEDWIEENKELHKGWTVRWPGTALLTDLGMVDSFRYIFPDPTQEPGITWSPCDKFMKYSNYTVEEPQDRIDFIFYKGPIEPVDSLVYAGYAKISPIPNHIDNDWPSDHYALITDFAILSHQ